MSALTEALSARADDLAERAMGEMYRNPFWDERFGERGRRFAREDGRYHITYLVSALEAEGTDILTAYAVWLRGVLVPRGMCSRHLAKNFARLVEGIRSAEIPDGETACAYLQHAIEALRYAGGAAGAVQEAAPELSRAALERLVADHPNWPARMAPLGLDRCRDDLQYHLSYLADSLALERADLFQDYLCWIVGFLERRGVPRQDLDTALAALAEAIDERLSPSAAVPARELLSAGRLAVAESGA